MNLFRYRPPMTRLTLAGDVAFVAIVAGVAWLGNSAWLTSALLAFTLLMLGTMVAEGRRP